jgi:3-oxoacyl-[acyl-carrier-protein] synthase II
MADGGAVFVLETAGAARKRSAKRYGEIAGYGSASDAYHLVSPAEDPRWGALAIERALADAGISPDDLDYVNAHGTGTRAGDVFETQALHAALGEAAATVPVSATKSMTGHLIGGASALEAAICLMAFERQAIPPTINLDEVDPECTLNHVAHRAIEAPVEWAMSGSFGFGGSNTCLILRKAA